MRLKLYRILCFPIWIYQQQNSISKHIKHLTDKSIEIFFFRTWVTYIYSPIFSMQFMRLPWFANRYTVYLWSGANFANAIQFAFFFLQIELILIACFFVVTASSMKRRTLCSINGTVNCVNFHVHRTKSFTRTKKKQTMEKKKMAESTMTHQHGDCVKWCMWIVLQIFHLKRKMSNAHVNKWDSTV